MPLSQEDYLKPDAGCPVCRSIAIKYNSFNVEGNKAFQEASCNDCHSTWNDVYTISGYTILVERDDPHTMPDDWPLHAHEQINHSNPEKEK